MLCPLNYPLKTAVWAFQQESSYFFPTINSSRICGFCFLKYSSKTLQNLPQIRNNKKTPYSFSFFFIFFLRIIWENKVVQNDICIPKNGKFWSVSLKNFIKHKPPFSVEWTQAICRLFQIMGLVTTDGRIRLGVTILRVANTH